jgi:hypothetical protein
MSNELNRAKIKRQVLQSNISQTGMGLRAHVAGGAGPFKIRVG